jgi:hypothetical protein
MLDRPDNVVPFPLDRRPMMNACPQCGSRSELWPIGRLVWGYCTEHEVRWVAADLKTVHTDQLDRRQMRRGLEFLAGFIEVSH